MNGKRRAPAGPFSLAVYVYSNSAFIFPSDAGATAVSFW
jgi:hypothetical protein